jgi:hypothetical protein
MKGQPQSHSTYEEKKREIRKSYIIVGRCSGIDWRSDGQRRLGYASSSAARCLQGHSSAGATRDIDWGHPGSSTAGLGVN